MCQAKYEYFNITIRQRLPYVVQEMKIAVPMLSLILVNFNYVFIQPARGLRLGVFLSRTELPNTKNVKGSR